MVQWHVNGFGFVHIEILKYSMNILPMAYGNGTLCPILNQLEPHNQTWIFFHSECFMQLIPCDFEFGGRISQAQNIIDMDHKDGNIAIWSFSDIDGSIQVGLMILDCGEFMMQELVPALSHLTKTI
jgi:hypothetical protein